MPKNVEQEINDFLEIWDCDQINLFFKNIIPLLNLYNVDEDKDWVKDIVGKEDLRNIRLIRTVYLLSIICENHSGKMAQVKIHYKDLYKRLEVIADENRNI